MRGSDLFGGDAIINIFNVQKVMDRGRIRTLRETIGESYFDYLAGLPDLVMLMDEAHRYRAAAGMRAISELRPVLRLELTATPKSVGARSAPFKNVVFEYGLGNAMLDGFVKEPAVATRANFRRDTLDQDQLETIILEDGIHYHEHVRAELDLYARQTGRERVHPFVLVVAQDTAHADRIRARIESDDFFSGAYKDLVAVVHSNLTGQESDDAIVPLRASASDILTEQTLGRGLRLPYGTRTGVDAVDTLTVIAHDRFEKVVELARADGSLVKVKQVTIGTGGDVGDVPPTIIEVRPTFDSTLTGRLSGVSDGNEQEPFIFDSEGARRTAEVALDFITKKYERELSGGVAELGKPEVQRRLAADVRRALSTDQGTLEGVIEEDNTDEIVGIVAARLIENLIEIPQIVVIPTREVNFWFEDFELSGLDAIRFQPLADTILIQTLRDEARRELALAASGPSEARVEDYIVRHLIGRQEIDYDAHADLLYKLAGQAVAHLRSYLIDDAGVENVALRHGKALSDTIFAQMMQHYRETPADYQVKVVREFQVLQPVALAWEGVPRDLRSPVSPLAETRRQLFTGTKKSPYNFHRFQSDPERRLAVLLEGTLAVKRWLKPGPGQFPIEYAAGKSYEPDFVVELDDEKLIIEVKADKDMQDPAVLDKARAASTWVKHANELATSDGRKRWTYLLVPEAALTAAATLSGLESQFARSFDTFEK